MALTKVRGAGAEGLTLSSTALTIANGLTLTDGNVTLASGHGIDFAATSDGTTMTGELLDDYEEGTFTASMSNSVTLDSNYNSLAYTKVGRCVTVGGQLRMSSTTPANTVSATLAGRGRVIVIQIQYHRSNNILQNNICGKGQFLLVGKV